MHGMLGSTVRSARAALALVAIVVAGPTLASGRTITILHVNDTHSHLDATGPRDRRLDGTVGGLAKAATVLARLRAQTPDALFVHAGDVFNEDLYFVARLGPGGAPLLSVPELRLLGGLGLDVLTVGNHELAYGPGVLAQVLGAAFPAGGPAVLSANLDLAAAGLGGLVRGNVVREAGTLRVGFFGLTVSDPLSQGAPFLGSTPEALAELARAQVADLRAAQHADVVVCVSHLGGDADRTLAQQVSGIDAIIGGHDHVAVHEPVLVTAPDGRSVPIVRAGEFYEWVGKLTLRIEDGRVSLDGYELVPVDATVPRLPVVATAVHELQDAIDALYGEDFWHDRIGFALADVAKDVHPSSPLRDAPIGNLVTDALRAKTRTDVALTAAGFFTEGLWHGPLVRDDAFRIVGDGIDDAGAGLGFPLYRLELTGANLLRALEISLDLEGDDFRVHASGMSYVFDSRRDAGSRLLSACVHGQPIDPARAYTVTANLGVVLGLGQFPGVVLARDPERVGVSEYEAVRDWIARLGVVLYLPEGRVVDVALAR